MTCIFHPTDEMPGFIDLLTELSARHLFMPKLTNPTTLDDPIPTPIKVPVSPRPGFEPGHCWYNSKIHSDATGGSVVFGWALYAEHDARLMAQHHAVWKTPDGDLVDVTPNPWVAEVLFLPDHRVPFDYDGFRCPYSLERTPKEGFMWVAPPGSQVERSPRYAICVMDTQLAAATMQAALSRYLKNASQPATHSV